MKSGKGSDVTLPAKARGGFAIRPGAGLLAEIRRARYSFHMYSQGITTPFTAADGSLMALVDCDTFYASCERVARPDLAGKPIVVLSNNDGCIVSMSREARALGLPMGKPEFQVRQELVRHGVAVFSSNYALYGDLSHRVMLTLGSLVPEVEVYSIDEAFLPLAGALAANAPDIAKALRERVLRWVGLPVSIGIAPTRVLAKIAARVAKKFPAYGGVFDLSRSAKLDEILEWVKVGDVWGLGRKGAHKLACEGIRTARELRDAGPDDIGKLLGVRGRDILMELRGIPATGDNIPAARGTVISSRSLGCRVTLPGPMREAVAFHAALAAEKLRARKHVAGMVGVRIQTARYRDDEPAHDGMTMVRLDLPTADSIAIAAAAGKGLDRIFRPGHAYARVMVMLTDLSEPSRSQRDMREMLDGRAKLREKRARLMKIMDRINRLEGSGTLRLASQGPKNAPWRMKRERLSPRWTSDFRELLPVCGAPGERREKCDVR